MTGESIIYSTDAFLLALLLFFGMLGAILLGSKLGRVRFAKHEENPANSTVVASLFGLLAFLLAFTFGMSANRFDSRREAIVGEANAIGTAMLRADLYPDTVRQLFRQEFKAYIAARISYFDAGRDQRKVGQARVASDSVAGLLWKRAASLARKEANFIQSNQMIPALNEMFDNAEIRLIRESARVPDSIVFMLFALCVVSAFYVGYISAGKGKPDWFIILGFCLLTSVVIFITLDLDRPRRGFIRLDSSHQAMLDLLKL